MNFDRTLTHLRTYLEHLWHLRVRYHFNTLSADTCDTINEGLNMGHVMGLNIKIPISFVTTEHREDHERLLLV